MKFARETTNRANFEICPQKRQRTAALQDAVANSCLQLIPQGFGVRLFSTAFKNSDARSSHASRITHHFSESAFTLAEVLASLVFMAILIPVALEALSIATRAGEVAARKGEAALVAERVLNENVITTNWNKSVQSGTIRQGIREFRWTLHNDPWNQDTTQSAMRQLSVEVLYSAQGRDYLVRMNTLVDSTPAGTQSTQVQ